MTSTADNSPQETWGCFVGHSLLEEVNSEAVSQATWGLTPSSRTY